ncbi:hypothetical protein ACFVXG_45585 [Kitasatospora sp. NPDC058162]|uniref:hypothetical protein n=1 Tax=Kitasatospora sp. NPDC058162 TaxID=3346362 RepID=UPI0036DDDE07
MTDTRASTQACDRPERYPNPNNSDAVHYDVECQHCDGWLCIACGDDHVDDVGQLCDGCCD